MKTMQEYRLLELWKARQIKDGYKPAEVNKVKSIQEAKKFFNKERKKIEPEEPVQEEPEEVVEELVQEEELAQDLVQEPEEVKA